MQFWKRYYPVYVLAFVCFCALGIYAAQRVRAVSAAALQEPVPVVLIDPGHGGEDGGAVSKSGTKESELNLAVSLRLRDLCTLLGIDTRMLRTEDVSLGDDAAQTVAQRKSSDLRKRAEIVRQTPGALLVSVHQNSFPQGPGCRGAQVFYADTPGSQTLAEEMQATINACLDPDNHRACKPSEGVYLLDHIDCAGILVECGFLSNAEEEAMLKTAGYQKQLACTLAAVLIRYLGENSP